MKLQLIVLTAFVTSVIAVPLAEMQGSESKRDTTPEVRFSSTSYMAMLYNEQLTREVLQPVSDPTPEIYKLLWQVADT